MNDDMLYVHFLYYRSGSPSTSFGLGISSHNGSSTFRYKLNNRMPYILGRLLPGAGQYNILFTDYERFALVWSCTNYSIAHSGTWDCYTFNSYIITGQAGGTQCYDSPFHAFRLSNVLRFEWRNSTPSFAQLPEQKKRK